MLPRSSAFAGGNIISRGFTSQNLNHFILQFRIKSEKMFLIALILSCQLVTQKAIGSQ